MYTSLIVWLSFRDYISLTGKFPRAKSSQIWKRAGQSEGKRSTEKGRDKNHHVSTAALG